MCLFSNESDFEMSLILQCPARTMSEAASDVLLAFSIQTESESSRRDCLGESAFPCDITVNRSGHFIVVDQSSATVKVFDEKGLFLYDMGAKQLGSPRGVFNTNSGKIVVSDPANADLKVFSKSGKYLMRSEWGMHLIEPYGIAYHPSTCQVAIGDKGASCVYVHSPKGTVRHVLTVRESDGVKPMQFPGYVMFDVQGSIVVSDSETDSLYKFDTEGDLAWTYNSSENDAQELKQPCGLCVDESTNNILVADSGNARIALIDSDGEFLMDLLSWEDGLSDPQSLLINKHNLIITETTGIVKVFNYQQLLNAK